MRMLLLLVGLLGLGAASADEYVNGYVRRDGTYVAPHMRSSPNQFRYDNYSSQGNINPYTGAVGTRPSEFTVPASPSPRTIQMPSYPALTPYSAPTYRYEGQSRTPGYGSDND